jgi:hypothetical protein
VAGHAAERRAFNATYFQRNGASCPVMDAEVSCRYRTAPTVSLRFGAESRWQWARAGPVILLFRCMAPELPVSS